MDTDTKKNKVTSHKIFWRCWRTARRASLQTDLFNLEDENPNITILQVSQCILIVETGNKIVYVIDI